jgi:DtxR family Mn-dependent transcriptional regulator
MTTEAADRLAAQIGNPVFDPHGDPIPTHTGELPAYSGLSLANLKEGDQARILHMEDEPGYIYEQLVALGLYPGQLIYVIHVADDKITFAAEGEECVLTPLFASGITVEKLAEPALLHGKGRLLTSLEPGESATVIAISPHCRGQQRRRLMDLGILPGTKVDAVLKSASGDPKGYRILGATIGIRKSQSDLIYISD